MSKCKYPDAVCINMTVCKGQAYCDGKDCVFDSEEDAAQSRVCDESDDFAYMFDDKVLR